MSKVIECLEQNIQKQVDCKRPSKTTQMNRLQNIQIEIWKYKALGNTKHNQVKLVLAVFVSACLYQYSIKLY